MTEARLFQLLVYASLALGAVVICLAIAECQSETATFDDYTFQPLEEVELANSYGHWIKPRFWEAGYSAILYMDEENYYVNAMPRVFCEIVRGKPLCRELPIYCRDRDREIQRGEWWVACEKIIREGEPK